jgi:uncharacterized membrane protein YgdD (TMEM256/DUF423 family)
MARLFLATGSLFAFIAIAAGAFGAHFLKKHLDAEMMSVFETAVRYQMYHAIALIIIAVALEPQKKKWANIAGWFFITGVVLFSGSLYILSLTGMKWIVAFTPLGGITFLFGWVCLALVGIIKSK